MSFSNVSDVDALDRLLKQVAPPRHSDLLSRSGATRSTNIPAVNEPEAQQTRQAIDPDALDTDQIQEHRDEREIKAHLFSEPSDSTSPAGEVRNALTASTGTPPLIPELPTNPPVSDIELDEATNRAIVELYDWVLYDPAAIWYSGWAAFDIFSNFDGAASIGATGRTSTVLGVDGGIPGSSGDDTFGVGTSTGVPNAYVPSTSFPTNGGATVDANPHLVDRPLNRNAEAAASTSPDT